MTTLEIILITYICISQILSMLILNSSTKNNRQAKIVLFSILNPLGIMVAFIIDYIEDRRRIDNEKRI